jgi:fructan beta-fructosidase
VDVPDGAKLTFNVRGAPVTVMPTSVAIGDRSTSVSERVKKVELLIDTASIEAFLNDGEVSLTRFALGRENGISVRADGGMGSIRSLELFPLRSAWDNTTSARPAD